MSTEHPRIELVDGAVLDLFCSMYSVSCKVVNFHYYFHQHFLRSRFLRVTTYFHLTPLLGPDLPGQPPYSSYYLSQVLKLGLASKNSA